MRCRICGKIIWINSNGMRLTDGQLESLTGKKKETTMYFEGEFAHKRCFFGKQEKAE